MLSFSLRFRLLCSMMAFKGRKYYWGRPDPKYFHLFLDETRDAEWFSLSGCIINDAAHTQCQARFESIKTKYFSTIHTAIMPIIFRRKEISSGDYPFRFRDSPEKKEEFHRELIGALYEANFTSIHAIVHLNNNLQEGDRLLDAYRKALPFVLFRYCGYLHRQRVRGDVFAEAIGENENNFLKSVYLIIRNLDGAEGQGPNYFKAVLTSKHLHIEEKEKNYAGLQVADLLAAPMLRKLLFTNIGKAFDVSMAEVGDYKINKRFCDGRTADGYGWRLLP